jgi:hypothetical protein
MHIRRVLWAMVLLALACGAIPAVGHFSGAARALVIAPGDPVAVHLHPTDDQLGSSWHIFETYSLILSLSNILHP